MKLQFDSNQQYQLDAINSVVNLFEGQPLNKGDFEVETARPSGQQQIDGGFVIGNNLQIKQEELIKNLHKIQEENKLEKSEVDEPENITQEDGSYILTQDGKKIQTEKDKKLKEGMNFSVEMETGTGKTYVYLRTIHELHKKYGFKKFIIVVPSIAIKEGVIKNLQITKSHFDTLYDNPKMDFYVYDPKKRGLPKNFATTNSLQVMVINIDSFAISKEKSNKRIIFQDSDWGRPIDYITKTNPIVIVDEPQNMESDTRKQAIQNLNPLFTLRYSATHRNLYNLIYRLDPVKAYDLGLVKKIEVDSILEEGNLNEPFVELESVKAQKGSISAKLKIDVSKGDGIVRKAVNIKKSPRKIGECNLYNLSGERDIYKGYVVDSIDAINQSVSFSNGRMIYAGQSIGGMNDEIMKFQIRQTVINHLEKERKLQGKGIKVLSLFFIDRVSNYRNYSNGGFEKGKIALWFEEVLQELKENPAYSGLIANEIDKVHNGYFSKDNSGKWKDTKGESKADDDTYNLIMKDKEKLLSFENPLKFIFSHSALREGWDNPNVFQICTLNEGQSEIKKRQEIGRGLRLPINQEGERIFDENMNILTVIANESYDEFARKLQTELSQDCGVEFGSRIKNKRKRVKIGLTKAYKLNEDFKRLWDRIKYKTKFRVDFSNEELIDKAIGILKQQIIREPKIISLKGRLDIKKEGVTAGLANISEKKPEYKRKELNVPNILGYIQAKTKLTRKTIIEIIRKSEKNSEIANNPQLFMDLAVSSIRQALRELMVDGVKYEKIQGENSYYAMELFENEELESYLENTVKVQNQEKTLYDHVLIDSEVESEFAKDLESMEKVKFYFKLPYWFKIETPIGSYNPDWAVVFEGDKKVYFVAETKGTEEWEQLRDSEKAKIQCGEKHFSTLEEVKFRWGRDFQEISNDFI
ncbi:MAG: DEAD/DEAH box helicase family protein [Patescibacteria group bacterium]